MKEIISLEEIDARFYSALAEFERLISHGVLSLEESNRKRELEEIMSVSTQLLFCSYKN